MLCKYESLCWSSAAHAYSSKRIEQHLMRSVTDSTTIWHEVEDSFVANAIGGRSQTGSRL
jgi:hypothetical protein